MVDREWRRAAIVWLMAAITAAVMVHITTTVIPNADGSRSSSRLAIELAAIPLLATWQKARAGSSHLKEA